MKEIITNSPFETRSLGEKIGKLLQPGDIICLEGDLGAGKTLFSKGVAAGLGIAEEEVSSPTFTLINEYQGRLPLYHMDVYRLDDEEAMEGLGLDEYFYGTGTCLVEWANKLGSLTPQEALFIEIISIGENERQISLKPVGERYNELLEELI